MSEGDKTLVKNAASEKQVKKAAKKEELEANRVIDDLKAILDMPEGRRVISRWLAQFKIGQMEWKPGAEINRNVGHHECANYILGQVVRVDPDIGAKMLIEAYEREIENGNL